MKSFFLSIFFLTALTSFAQDELLKELNADLEAKPLKTINTFKGIKLINANTTETTGKGELEFRVTHRFGDMELDNSTGYHTYFGLDNASNIRLSLDYGLTENLSVGFGRSKSQEHLDWNAKYRFLNQQKGKMPVSVAYYVDMAVTAVAKAPKDRFVNRFSYAHQLIIARKFNKAISLELLPTLVHRNFVNQQILHPTNGSTDENDLFSLGAGGRFKITKRMAVVVDYFYTFSEFRDSKNDFYDALGVGIEIETGGHVFHINVTNSSGIIESDFIPYTNSAWDRGEYKLGFNISRVFTF